MTVGVFVSSWGLEPLGIDGMLDRVAAAGFDGVEVAVPEDPAAQARLRAGLDRTGLGVIGHEYGAAGDTFEAFHASYRRRLERACAFGPRFVNSHTGRDGFTDAQNDALVETAADVAARSGVDVLHETHRGRFLYAPPVARGYFRRHPALRVVADLSHWCVVSESLLEGHAEALDEAVRRADHVHARVGSSQAAQVPRPLGDDWRAEREAFVGWWRRIVAARAADGRETMTVTCETGPPPYLWVVDGEPVADAWDQNVAMLGFLREAL